MDSQQKLTTSSRFPYPLMLLGSNQNPSRLALWSLLILLFLLIVLPIGVIILNGFDVSAVGESFQLGLRNWQGMGWQGSTGRALRNTLALTTIRVGVGFTLASIIAWLLTRTDIPGRAWLEFGFWTSFFLPALSAVQGWVFLLEGRVGIVNQWLKFLPLFEEDPFNIYSFWGIVWVHLMSHSVSSIVIFMIPSFRNMDSLHEDAARVCGASILRIITKVFLPLMRPTLGVALILGMIRGLQSFEVERLLGTRAGIQVYGTVLVEMLNGVSPRVGQASALSTLILLILIPLVIGEHLFLKRRRYETMTGQMRFGIVKLGALRWFAFGFVLVVVLLLTVVPFSAVLAGSLMTRWGYFSIAEPWTLKHWTRVLSNHMFINALLTTLKVAVLSALASIVIGFLSAYWIVRSRYRERHVLDFMSWLPWAFPSILLSLGFLVVVLRAPLLRPFYGSLLLLALAIVVFRFPLAVQLLKVGLLQISEELEEASKVSGGSWFQTQVNIVRPLLTPMLVTVALMTFIAAANEVNGVILLASVEKRTLSLLSFDYLVAHERETAAVITTVITILAMAAALGVYTMGIRTLQNPHSARGESSEL